MIVFASVNFALITRQAQEAYYLAYRFIATVAVILTYILDKS